MCQEVKVKLTSSVKKNLAKTDLRMKISVRVNSPLAAEEKGKELGKAKIINPQTSFYFSACQGEGSWYK